MIEWKKFNLASLFRRNSTLKFAYSVVLLNVGADADIRGRAQETVLRDLARYCHAMSAAENDRAIGRRDVWLYINKFLKLSEDELTILYSGADPEARYQLHSPGPTYLDEE